MAVKKIITVPDQILNIKCNSVTAINEEINSVVKDLLDTLDIQRDPAGAGLAAPQIGLPINVCVVRKFSKTKEGVETTRDIVLINPKIVSQSEATDIRWEACLSIPNSIGQVKRSKRVSISYLNLDGTESKIKADGFLARVIQHEMDHLNGILFTSKVIGKLYDEQEFDKEFISE